jgi:hypothetical protein
MNRLSYKTITTSWIDIIKIETTLTIFYAG